MTNNERNHAYQEDLATTLYKSAFTMHKRSKTHHGQRLFPKKQALANHEAASTLANDQTPSALNSGSSAEPFAEIANETADTIKKSKSCTDCTLPAKQEQSNAFGEPRLEDLPWPWPAAVKMFLKQRGAAETVSTFQRLSIYIQFSFR